MTKSKQTSLSESKVDCRLKRIANVLLLNASFIDNIGLLNGKMGIAIFLYHYSRYAGNKIFEDYAGELIDEIYEEINKNTPVDFANGLIGIGWGIEYLVKNGFVEADTDEILEHIDNTVYQKILLEFDYNELQGYLLYQLARFKVKNDGDRQKEFIKMHTLLCLLNECEKLFVYRKFKEQIAFPNLTTLKIVQYFLAEVDKAGLFPNKTKILFDLLPSFIEIATANKESENETIVDRATAMAWQQLVYHSVMDLETDINSIIHVAFKFIDDEENWHSFIKQLNTNSCGINKGLAGLGITMLRLMSDLISQQFEVLKTINTSANLSENSLSVFIFKSNARGMQYGMGTYIRELTEAMLAHTDVKLFTVTYHNRECNEFSIDTIS